ncbi:sporulation histidine kinase inhibitor Sda [Bacillaceae bacterium W0354]
MNTLSDKLLVETHHKAVRLQLEEDFIKIIEQEMRRRKLEVPSNQKLYTTEKDQHKDMIIHK